eukprot:1957393-Rhodomonas_salina.1
MTVTGHDYGGTCAAGSEGRCASPVTVRRTTGVVVSTPCHRDRPAELRLCNDFYAVTVPHDTCVQCGTQQSQHEDEQGGVEQHYQPDVADCQGRTAEREAQEHFWPVEGPSTLEIWVADLTIPLGSLGRMMSRGELDCFGSGAGLAISPFTESCSLVDVGAVPVDGLSR